MGTEKEVKPGHTPGPWHWTEAGEGCTAFDVEELRGPDDVAIMYALQEGGTDDAFIGFRRAPDARLIAIAWTIPDLVAACEELLKREPAGDESTGAVARARAALARVKGG